MQVAKIDGLQLAESKILDLQNGLSFFESILDLLDLSSNSRKTYKRNIIHFVAFIEQQKLNRLSLRQFKNALKGKN